MSSAIAEQLQIYGSRDGGAARPPISWVSSPAEEADAFLDYLRYGASPGMLEALLRMNKDIDIRHVLPLVRVPTLVLHGGEDRLVPVEAGTIPR